MKEHEPYYLGGAEDGCGAVIQVREYYRGIHAKECFEMWRIDPENTHVVYDKNPYTGEPQTVVSYSAVRPVATVEVTDPLESTTGAHTNE